MMDFHCHLDLYKNPMEVFGMAKKHNDTVLAVTTSPRAYVKAKEYFGGADTIHVGLGFHPELLANRTKEIDMFMELIKTARFIGEVGLDGSAALQGSYDLQKSFFASTVEAAESYGNKIVSIHSKRASKDVVDTLSKTSPRSKYILHWFTGTQSELKRALSYGCWFSINPKMCFSESGRALIRLLPIERIIPETDAPFTGKNNIPYMPWDTTVINYISTERHLSKEVVLNMMENNAQTLLSFNA